MRILFIPFAFLILLLSCKSENKPKVTSQAKYTNFRGQTMGTSYNIVFQEAKQVLQKEHIDSILLEINLSVSTYIDSSTISMINNSKLYGEEIEILKNGTYEKSYKSSLPYDQHFVSNFEKAHRIYLNSDGAFDPTIMPLVNYWGFGYTEKKPVVEIDSHRVHNILKYIGMDKINFETNTSSMTLIKPSETELDFSAIAKGYAVDVIADYLKENGVTNMMVEIGGEVYALGKNPKNTEWKLGLNTPKENAAINDFQCIVNLDGKGLASSGNYRIFHVINSKKYGHEINPLTGYPELNDLLAVSVLAPTCMEADATATALMVMGLAKATAYVESYPQLEAAFFTSDSSGQIVPIYTEGLSKIIME